MSFPLTAQHRHLLYWLASLVALFALLIWLGPVLMPFIVAAILAYILHPWVERLCSPFRIGRTARRLPRALATSLVLLVLITLCLALLLVLVPILHKEIPQLQNQIPRLFDALNRNLSPLLDTWGIGLRLDSEGLKALLAKQWDTSGEAISRAMLASLRVGGTAVLGLLANLVLIPIVLFYLLLDWHALLIRLLRFIPVRWQTSVRKAAQEADHMLGQYLHGQLLVMFSLAAYYTIALSLVRFELALPVGILTGMLVIIPYLGYGLGLSLALLGGVLQYGTPGGLLGIIAVYALGQFLESFLLTPRLVGERIGLHPLAVIFALMAFGQVFGFLGILLALPASALIAVGLRHLRQAYLRSPFYTQS